MKIKQIATKLPLLIFLFVSCKSSQNREDFTLNPDSYSNFFAFESDNTSSTLLIAEAWEKGEPIKRYKLIPRDSPEYNASDIYSLPVPLQKIVCMSTSHIAFLEAIGADSLITGVSGARYINNPKILEGIRDGSIVDIGYEALLDYEVVKTLNPDVVFAYGIQGSDNTYIEKLKQYGITVLSLPDFLEQEPLGKLEYIKIFGRLTGRECVADSIFNTRANIYNTLCEQVNSLEETSPVPVIVNTPWKDIWYIPGKKSNFSHLIHDAGGYIVGAKDGEINASPYSVESAYMLCMESKYWLNLGSISSVDELIAINPLFTSVPPIVNGKIFNNTLRSGSGGGNDFYETGVVEPHLILEDLIRILHPGLLPEGKLHYYKQLIIEN